MLTQILFSTCFFQHQVLSCLEYPGNSILAILGLSLVEFYFMKL